MGRAARARDAEERLAAVAPAAVAALLATRPNTAEPAGGARSRDPRASACRRPPHAAMAGAVAPPRRRRATIGR